jgi:general secretion pathway protein L
MKHITSTALRNALKFLNWWVLELSTALEALRSQLIPGWRRSVTVYVSRSRLQIVTGDSRNNPAILEVTRTEPASELTLALSDAERATLAGGRRARLVFDSELAFVRPLRMPLAALPHLASAIGLQQPKLLPLDTSLLRSDFEIVAIDSDDASVDIELAALKRSDIDPIESALERWGLQLGSVHLGTASDSRVRFKFGAPDARANRFAITRVDTFWAASAAALAICAVAVFAVQAVRAHRSLEQALAQTSGEAATVLQQRQRLISRLETLSLLSQAERAPTAAAILADVTAHLNRDAWLTTFELKGRDLRLVGLSSESAELVKELAASAFLTEVELHSSMSAGANTGKDRFEITAQVKTGT